MTEVPLSVDKVKDLTLLKKAFFNRSDYVRVSSLCMTGDVDHTRVIGALSGLIGKK